MNRLDTDTCLAPMSSLGVVSMKPPISISIHLTNRHTFVGEEGKEEEEVDDVPDGVACPETDPLWDRSILLLRFRELLLRAEGFVALGHR